MKANDIVKVCNELKTNWSTRAKQFQDWYDLLLLTNNLHQEDMESVISSDPRTAYNLALNMLTASTMTHKIPTEGLSQEEVASTSYLEQYISTQWGRLEQQHRRLGRQSWLREMIGLVLATGWYSVFAWVTDDTLIAEVWNPANVYPSFSSDGLESCAHIYTLTPTAANRKARRNNWVLPRPFNADVKVYNYWTYSTSGEVVNAIVMGNVLVKPLTTLSITEQKSDRIPIFTSPVAGLPDMGAIKQTSKDWQKNFGESIVAVGAEEFNNHNKMLTYIQQLVRDTANPRWFERSRSTKGILNPQTIFKRGAIFRGTPEDSVETVPMPAIPVELRTILFDYGNRIQRCTFPWVLYGNIQQEMAGYMVSQIASAALGTLTPYADAIKGVLADVDNYWLVELRERKLNTYGFKPPKKLPEFTEFTIDFNINIPGSLVQRATIARMLNPTFKLGFNTTCDLIFPEVVDPVREQAIAAKDDALTNPIAQTLAMIQTYREQARIYKDAKDDQAAALFTKAADMLEASITPQPSPEAAPSPGRPIGTPRGALPSEEVLPPSPELGGM